MRKRGIREKPIAKKIRLFLQKSYKAISIKDITSAANINKFKDAHKVVTEFSYENRWLRTGFAAIEAELMGSNTEVETAIKLIYSRYLRSDIDIDIAAHFIMGTHNGMMLEWYGNPGDEPGRLFAKAHGRILLHGIIKEKQKVMVPRGRNCN